MITKAKLLNLVLDLTNIVDEKAAGQFGFSMRDVSFEKVVEYLHKPKDSSSLAVTRILFGLAMLFDIPDERGGAIMDKRWGDPKTCHYPLIPFIQAMPLPYMALVYAVMWIGALGIMLGFKYRLCAGTYAACHWYLLLVDKSLWNNHSYLFGLVALLLTFTNAHSHWSVDAYLQPRLRSETVPYWNYFILKYQFFILYFMAGLKKGTSEWLSGYSVQKLAEHWVFGPFKLFLTVPQIDYIIVHWFIFAFDLTVAFWMMWAPTRNIAMMFCALFHLMNSRLFRIGMFPWVCLATQPLFYPFDWPKTVKSSVLGYYNKYKEAKETRITEYTLDNCDGDTKDLNTNDGEGANKTKAHEGTTITEEHENIRDKCNSRKKKQKKHSKTELQTTEGDSNENQGKCKKIRTIIIFFYMLIQAVLPYSHFITKGYNNWTDGLYGYSWDMMVHSWDEPSVVVKVIDNANKKDFFIDPDFYNLNGRWAKHGDMLLQYARCLKRNLEEKNLILSNNMSIYVDVWCSMNERFVQRMFDPKIDLLKEQWSPFKKVSYLLPLLDEASEWRSKLQEIRDDVHSWSEYSDVVFYANFPGHELEKFIPTDMQNVTLSILEGTVVFEPETADANIGQSHKLTKGNVIDVDPGKLHRVLNIGRNPAFFMYTFYSQNIKGTTEDKPKLPVGSEFLKRLREMKTFGELVFKHLYQLFFRMPVSKLNKQM